MQMEHVHLMVITLEHSTIWNIFTYHKQNLHHLHHHDSTQGALHTLSLVQKFHLHYIHDQVLQIDEFVKRC